MPMPINPPRAGRGSSVPGGIAKTPGEQAGSARVGKPSLRVLQEGPCRMGPAGANLDPVPCMLHGGFGLETLLRWGWVTRALVPMEDTLQCCCLGTQPGWLPVLLPVPLVVPGWWHAVMGPPVQAVSGMTRAGKGGHTTLGIPLSVPTSAPTIPGYDLTNNPLGWRRSRGTR